MKKILLILLSIFLFAYSASCSEKTESNPETAPPVSGMVVNGYRILPVETDAGKVDLKVYRGDYIKFKFDPAMRDPLLSIPDLAIQKRLPNNAAEAPYFKMKTPGTYAFSLGDIDGNLTVINYRATSYREVSAREAAEIIKNEQPLILDVRTPNEYKLGHLHNSVLIPVQELQSRSKELGARKDREILIYCATGNRSTVASKILIDNGFKHIVNMRGGIYDWSKKKYPIKR
jgi:rhodanese-related sulfurtransferase